MGPPVLTEPTQIFDPELLIPSSTSGQDLAFWLRMSEWSADPAPRVGPSTMRAFHQLISSPPQVRGLPTGEFWKIVGSFARRSMSASSLQHVVCESHVRGHYRPELGDAENIESLLADLRACEGGESIVLSTSSAAWDHVQSGCGSCAEMSLHLVDSPHLLEGFNPRHRVMWRQKFLDTYPTDVSKISAFADRLFPGMEFSTSAWDRLDTLEGDPSDVVRQLVLHLSVLNDSAATIWGSETSTASRQARMAALGVTASPESPQTHRNLRFMRERDFAFEAGTVRCEWHTKLRPNVNRVYFNVSDSGVVRVGMVVDHLSV